MAIERNPIRQKTDWAEGSKPLPNLPYEINVEILLRLPVKSLLRFTCACKSWRSLISDPKFAKTHLSLASSNTDYNHDKLLLSLTSGAYRPLDLKSCSISAIMYEQSHPAVSLDCPYDGPPDWFWIEGKFASGALHWIPSFGSKETIVSLDLATENYEEIPLPECVHSYRNLIMDVFGGCLRVLRNCDGLGLELWVMKEYGIRESWTKLFVIHDNIDTSVNTISLPKELLDVSSLISDPKFVKSHLSSASSNSTGYTHLRLLLRTNDYHHRDFKSCSISSMMRHDQSDNAIGIDNPFAESPNGLWIKGYDKSTDDYKVVLVNRQNKVVVYTFRADSWRTIEDCPHSIPVAGKGKFVSGAPPLDCEWQVRYHGAHVDLWVMKEYGIKESWTKLFAIHDVTHPLYGEFFTPKCILNNVDVLMVVGMRLVRYNPDDGSLSYPKIRGFFP
ncbi:hypothetical protein RHMOL_Rhmol02G0062100 [Rhododendron molle]|uniref:Uncharacterized protein n=1 Tax=Rhododendron molle TaxID=49168 RepID=A0ACC0PQ99_RHOML|nr:hypothetical protein RHMOL_Rhmol02G0062100 [Rhododendron molle]